MDFSIINEGQEDQMDVYGYHSHPVFMAISWLFTVLTLGGVRLVFHWWPHLMLYTTHYPCPLRTAEKLLIVEHPKKLHSCKHVETVKTLSTVIIPKEMRIQVADRNNSNKTIKKVIRMSGQKSSNYVGESSFIDAPFIKMFEFKKQRYIWDDEGGSFFKLEGLDSSVSTAYLHEQMGLSSSERKLRQLLYGMNEIAVPMQGITELLFLEVLNPFYIFQLFSFALWFTYEYVSYALAILIMSASSVIMTVIQTRDNQHKLHSTIHKSDTVSVQQLSNRNTEEAVVSTIPSEQLVPGDLILIPTHGCVLHCDAVLLNGTCIVNESILTGEGVPVTKIPLPNSHTTLYDAKEHGKHTLFCGTRVMKTRIQSGTGIYAVVIRTGFSTVKGELVRSILYPTPISLKFEQDSYKFIQLMALLASVGFIYTVITKLMRGVKATTVALEALDLVTVVVPPALPAAMTVGCMSAQARLRKHNIFCISPRMINVSGSINCICFDKTGTLTEDGLDIWGVVRSSEDGFDVPNKNFKSLEPGHLLYAMATCHSLTVIDENIYGDPLDVKMFEWTDWILEESDVAESSLSSTHMIVRPSKASSFQKGLREIEIIHQLPFSSSLQRMSVITKKMGGSCFTMYSKGSPEVIRDLCTPHSIPSDFERKLEEYTEKGYRVLGITYKEGSSNLIHLPQELMEKDLNFLGLVVFENRLKPRTANVIGALKTANIRSIMVTGDNQLTALNVARKCGIICPNQKVFMINVRPASDEQPGRLCYRPCQKSNMSNIETQTFYGESNLEHVTKSEKVETEYEICEGDTSISHFETFTAPNTSLVVTGAAWDFFHKHFSDKVDVMVKRGAVFSRMSPDQKQQLVLSLQSLGYYVGMCGDGANDCGALKAAHAGISLSEAESSVASPFTSRESTIDCVVKVIQEGRAALVTSFAIFKYMAGYSLTQFVSVMILYSIDSNLTDVQYLFVDLFIISVFAFLLGCVEANSDALVPQPPEISLMSPSSVASLIGQVAMVAIFQFISFFSLSKYDWFEPYDSTKSTSKGPGCFENYALFAISSMQYVILGVVFCKGAPYRLPLSKNWSLWGTVTAVTAFIFYLILWPSQWFQDLFELVVPPEMDFRVFCIILCVSNFILAVIYEFYICDDLITNKFRSIGESKLKKEKYE